MFFFRGLQKLQIIAIVLLAFGIVIVAIVLWNYDNRLNKPIYVSIDASLDSLVKKESTADGSVNLVGNQLTEIDSNDASIDESIIVNESLHSISSHEEDKVKKDIDEAAEELTISADVKSLININTATIEQLQQLKGIGEVKAQAIYDDRVKNGPFKRIEDIKRVKGIGEKIYAGIKESIVAD